MLSTEKVNQKSAKAIYYTFWCYSSCITKTENKKQSLGSSYVPSVKDPQSCKSEPHKFDMKVFIFQEEAYTSS